MPLHDLDGAPPDFVAHQTAAVKQAALTTARHALGACRWSEDLTRPAPPWLIPGFLQSQALHVISAPKSTRKTWLGLATLLAGATNTPLLGTFAPTTPFNSLYIGADSPRWDIRQQLLKLCRGSNLPIPVGPDAESFITPYGPKFTNPKHVAAIKDLVMAFNLKALFVDVMLYAYDNLNENDNTDMARLYQILKIFRDQFGLAIVLLHHHSKLPGTGARGAGTITQAAEHHFELHRKQGGIVRVVREKLRGDDDQYWPFLDTRLVRGGSPGGYRLEIAASSPVDWLRTTLATSAQARTTLLPLAALVGISARSLDRAAAALRDAGELTTDSGLWTLCQPPPSSSPSAT